MANRPFDAFAGGTPNFNEMTAGMSSPDDLYPRPQQSNDQQQAQPFGMPPPPNYAGYGGGYGGGYGSGGYGGYGGYGGFGGYGGGFGGGYGQFPQMWGGGMMPYGFGGNMGGYQGAFAAQRPFQMGQQQQQGGQQQMSSGQGGVPPMDQLVSYFQSLPANEQGNFYNALGQYGALHGGNLGGNFDSALRGAMGDQAAKNWVNTMDTQQGSGFQGTAGIPSWLLQGLGG